MRRDCSNSKDRARRRTTGEPRALARAVCRGPAARHPPGFTLVELLVVIVVITILVTAVVAVSTTFINKAKMQNTLGMLRIVGDAVEEFRREQTEQPTIVRAAQGGVSYATRYGYFPPDELEVFTDAGLPGSTGGTLAVGGALMVPDGPYQPMQFHQDGLSEDERAMEHRDLAAMIVAIDLLGQSSSVLLDGVPKRYRSSGSVDASGQPNQFLDRGANGWDADDLQVRYIVDDWGMPISYLAQRDWAPPPNTPADSSNLENRWNRASTEIIRLNDGQPIIMSYGPNGEEQLTGQAMVDDGRASLVADWMDGEPHRINHPLNEDNIYADRSLKKKLAKGMEP